MGYLARFDIMPLLSLRKSGVDLLWWFGGGLTIASRCVFVYTVRRVLWKWAEMLKTEH